MEFGPANLHSHRSAFRAGACLRKSKQKSTVCLWKALVWTRVHVCGVLTVPFPWHTTSIKIYFCDGMSLGHVRTDLEELQSYLNSNSAQLIKVTFIKGQPLLLWVMLPSNGCLWPLLLPEDCRQRGPLKISLMLGKIILGSRVLLAPLGNGETFKQRGYSSQLSIPLHFTGEERGSRKTDWSPRWSENVSVFTSSNSNSAECTCFPSC